MELLQEFNNLRDSLPITAALPDESVDKVDIVNQAILQIIFLEDLIKKRYLLNLQTQFNRRRCSRLRRIKVNH
uniref:Uncharacterized protein n=1 Tax=Tetranychus urticae TaxID=32264 RepID=T1K7S6_TETUR